jgi:hypothetical protein
VPGNIRRLNNHAAYRIVQRIGMPLYVKLVGLRAAGATRLNGRMGVIQHDASNANNLASSSARIVVSLDDGKQVRTWLAVRQQATHYDSTIWFTLFY